ncbi:MAG: ankyrin repeat domain-containing protein [Planctomycetota bacterium]|nr:MAG: ankyrin repeat domain-containing protein [Planctomycetota bacterium]
MKYLPLKLGIGVTVFFSLLLAGLLLWTPGRIHYYTGKFYSSDPGERVSAVSGLLGMGDKGVDVLAGELDGGAEAAKIIDASWNDVDKRIFIDELAQEIYWERSAIHEAAGKGYRDVVELLLLKGADIHCRATAGATALVSAAANGHVDTCKFLIRKGADVNSEAAFGLTPLHFAAGHGGREVVDFLIKNGANVNTDGKTTASPLHMAARYRQKEVLEFLIEKGADVNATCFGDTPLDKDTTEDIKAILRAHGGRTGEELKKSPESRVLSPESEKKK